MTMPTGTPSPEGTDPSAQGGAPEAGQPTDPTAPPSGAPVTPPAQTPEQIQAELEATKRRMQAADQNNSRLQAELKKLQDATLSETEKLKRDFADTQATVAKLQEENKVLKLQNAFVSDNTYTWHNPEAALKLADLSGVNIDEATGKVTGLKEALKAVADAHSWMLKPATTDATPPDPKHTPPGATGVGGTTGGKGSGGNDAATLAKKFPALQGRVS